MAVGFRVPIQCRHAPQASCKALAAVICRLIVIIITMLLQWLLWTLFCISFTHAQITTTVVDGAGDTIVEVITTDPVALTRGTTTIATLTSTQAATTTQNVGQVVGVPAATAGGGGETPYTYTTTNAQGLTTAIAAVFTPSFLTNPYTPAASSGTIMDYSSWLSLVGTNTVAATSAAGERWQLDARLWTIAAALSCGMLGGVWLTLV